MNTRFGRCLLLTGAGFTANFGGFLAKDMWSFIYNSSYLDDCQEIKKLLMETQNYEYVYNEILTKEDKYTHQDRKAIKESVLYAYGLLDEAVKSYRFDRRAIDSPTIFGRFFNILRSKCGEPLMFFTLNQDLFMERHYHWFSAGAPRFPDKIYGGGSTEIVNADFITMPRTDDVYKSVIDSINSHVGIQYVKLHGSYGWISGIDANSMMVIGDNKGQSIKQEPLLNAYFKLFEDVIAEGNKMLLIIGYGFGDLHVNELILEGIQKYNLQLCVVGPGDLTATLRNGQYYAMPIVNAVKGRFPHTLTDIFTVSSTDSPLMTQLINVLTRSNITD